jgi:hypothetical protein
MQLDGRKASGNGKSSQRLAVVAFHIIAALTSLSLGFSVFDKSLFSWHPRKAPAYIVQY